MNLPINTAEIDRVSQVGGAARLWLRDTRFVDVTPQCAAELKKAGLIPE